MTASPNLLVQPSYFKRIKLLIKKKIVSCEMKPTDMSVKEITL